MARIKIGNIKGPQGIQGPTGPKGATGATGPQGPLPPLANNGLATVAGVSALDAVMGKTLTDKDADIQQQVTQLNSNLGNFGNRIQSVKYFASTDNAGEYAWAGVSLSDFGITGKKLAQYPAIICCVNELTGAPGFYVTHANRLHDTGFNVVFSKGRTGGFVLACSFIVEDA